MTGSRLSRVNPLVKIAACTVWTTAAVCFRQPEPLAVLAATSLLLVLCTPRSGIPGGWRWYCWG